MKKSFVDKRKIEEITACIPTPFHLYDEKGIRNTIRDLYQAFSWNKGFCEYFAVKATPNPVLLKILAEEGCGVDCSSKTELMLADACGFKDTQIMFSSNDTPAEEFVFARGKGAIINLDDFSHIQYLEDCAGLPETICCRYNPGGNFSIHNEIMDRPKDAKYGMTKEQLRVAFLLLCEKGVKKFGLHAFLASNTLGGEYYSVLARQLFETAVWLKTETGVSVDFINLSGGIGIPYKPEDKANNIFEVGRGVKRAYEEVLMPAGLDQVAIFTELGRFILGPNGVLVTTVLHHKDIYKQYIGVDACAANLMRPAMYGAYHHITVCGKEDEPATHTYDITGSLCENNDKFAVDRQLPVIEIGDILVIHDTGAHGFSMGYNYNGKLRSAEVLLHQDGGFSTIRRAETPRDYFATLDIFPDLFSDELLKG